MHQSRIEKKFVFGKYCEDYLEKTLITNGFKEAYSPRLINSIYLDTLNYDFARDNINGVGERKKIRFRWYNDDLQNIFLEEKNKRNFTVKKIVQSINLAANKNKIVETLKSYFFKIKKNYNDKNYKFVLKTSYNRTYWLSEDSKIRATIDKNITTCPINDFKRKLDLNDTILEFKFDPTEENNFRNFFSIRNINFRSKKYSKYLQSFHLLDNSNLII